MQYKKEHRREIIYVLVLYMFYSLIGIIGKYNAETSYVGSIRFWLLLSLQCIGLLLFSLVWQRILKRLQLSIAYLFKGTTIIWAMLLATIIFKETVTINNMIGGVMIIIGIGVVLSE